MGLSGPELIFVDLNGSKSNQIHLERSKLLKLGLHTIGSDVKGVNRNVDAM